MGKKTTKVRKVEYFLSPATGDEPEQILQVREFTPPTVTRPEEDETCHEDENSQTTLGTPKAGPGSITILADLTSDVHLRMRDLALTASAPVWLVKGYDDGTAPPTDADAVTGFTLPTTRSWLPINCTLSNWREVGPTGQNTTWQFDLVPVTVPEPANKT